MKKIFIITSIILITKFSLCQTLTYNKLYTPYPNNSINTFNASSIINDGDHYYFVGYGNDTINSNFQSLIFCKLDSAANVSRKFMLTKAGWNYYPEVQTLKRCRSGGFLYLGQKDTSNFNPEHILIRFDDNLDTIWTRTIHNNNAEWESFAEVKETSDNGLIFVGAVEISLNNFGVLLVKTDSCGNQIWRKILYLPDTRGGSRIIEMPDKGFLIKGFHETQVTGDGGPFLVKTDILGNQQWYKDIGGNEYDGNAAIALTKDSNILVAYGYSTYTFQDNNSWSAKLNVIKYKLDGTEIWNKFYDTINRSLETLKIQILNDNKIIIMGYYDVDSLFYFSSFLFKINSNGDSLWNKRYYICKSNLDQNFLLDNELNSDNGITACGYVLGHDLNVKQQIWLLKTDSNGYAPGPQNVGIIDLPCLYVEYGALKVFPNPATTQTTLTFPLLSSQGQLQVYNMQGQKVYEASIPKNATQVVLDTKVYEKGLYKVVVSEKGEIRGQASLIKN
ncbi:MAG: T9SS type A sorting domain-containing protein [Bacteroidales bacterium]